MSQAAELTPRVKLNKPTMREYYINSKKVTKQEWSDFFKRNPKAKCILSTYNMPKKYTPPEGEEMTKEQFERVKAKVDQQLTLK